MGGGGSGSEVAVFVDTNLGTHTAFNAHHDITAAALKREFESVHIRCFPDTGEIQVNGLMVKRKSCFYYLPDSLPIKYAFPEMRRTWFLRVEVRHLKCLCIPCSRLDVAILSKPQDMETCNSEAKAICNTEEKRMEGFPESCTQNAASRMPEEKPTGTTNKSQHLMAENRVENPVKLHANSIQGSLSKMSTQVISVTGIINKYFSGFNGIKNFSNSSNTDFTSKAVCSEIEVQSNTRAHSYSKIQINPLPQSTAKTRCVLRAPVHVDSVSKKSRDKKRRSHLVSKKSGDNKRGSKVGNRLLVASRSLGVSPIKRSPTLSFCKFKDRNLVEYKSQVKGSVFSISDSDS